MKKYQNWSLITLYMLFCFGMQGQEAIFAYAYNANGRAVTLDSESSERFGSKYSTVKAILDDLVAAKGTLNMPSPQLLMNNGEQKPAWIDLKNGIVVLEEKAYDICTTMGSDSLAAIAVLLAHELTHYYEKHDWKNHFIQHYGSNLKENDKEEWQDQMQLELQADQLGGFLANMAGYNTTDVLDNLLVKLYSAYGLNSSENHLYPSLKERIAIANEGENQMALMSQAFEMSNYLTLIGEYATAFKYLDFIVIKSKFQSRELHNNRGILLALSALTYFSELEMPFVIPLELEMNSRLTRKGLGRELRDNYLKQASEALKSAISLDENYLAAYINLASVNILQKDYFEATYNCQKVLRHADVTKDAVQVAHAYVNLGIISYLENNIEDAKTHFEKASEYDIKGLAAYNQNVLYDIKIEETEKAKPLNFMSDSINLNELYSSIGQGKLMAKSQIEISDDLLFFLSEINHSHIYINLEDWGDKAFQFFQSTDMVMTDEFVLTKKNTKEEVEAILGEANSSLVLTNSEVKVYPYANLMVKYDKHKKAQEFIIIFKG